MEIKIGQSLFLGGDSVYKIEPPVSGLRSPAIRTLENERFSRDGGYVSGHFHGNRTIVIKGFYIGEDCEDAIDLRKTLLSYLRIRYRLPIRVTTAHGQYNTEGYVVDVKADIENLVAGEFQITLQCPDPVFYESLMGQVIWHTETLDDGVTGKNLFNNEATPIIKSTIVDETVLDTGIRITCNANGASGEYYSYCGYMLIEASKVAGKKLTLSFDTEGHTQDNKYRVYIGLCRADGTDRVSKSALSFSDNGHHSLSWTVVEDEDRPYIIATLYLYSGVVTRTVGEYIDYTNIKLEVGDESSGYIPYGDPVTKTIDNTGGVDVYPVITVTGIVDGIEIENATTGLTMQIDIETENADDEVKIDMEKREITVNGESANENRSLTSAWWCLQPGENEIVTSIGNSATAEIKYKKGFAGII